MQVMKSALEDVLSSSKERPAFYASPPPPDDPARTATDFAVRPTSQLNARIFLVEQRESLSIPDKDEAIIGRSHRQTIADVDLGPHGAADAGVSRHHARLIRQPEGWSIDDLNSLNGTYVNDVKIKPGRPVRLKDGDLIRCSHLSFLFLLTPIT
jgi:pSer/pThr/pTyr-binding forkhead associated (FHA) protein